MTEMKYNEQNGGTQPKEEDASRVECTFKNAYVLTWP